MTPASAGPSEGSGESSQLRRVGGIKIDRVPGDVRKGSREGLTPRTNEIKEDPPLPVSVTICLRFVAPPRGGHAPFDVFPFAGRNRSATARTRRQRAACAPLPDSAAKREQRQAREYWAARSSRAKCRAVPLAASSFPPPPRGPTRVSASQRSRYCG